MSVKTATEFLMDIQNHSDVPERAAGSDLEGLRGLAGELGFDDVTTDDLDTAIGELAGDGDDDEVSGFAMRSSMLGGLGLGGISIGEFGGTLAGKKGGGPSSSTHGAAQKKYPDPVCDCDAD